MPVSDSALLQFVAAPSFPPLRHAERSSGTLWALIKLISGVRGGKNRIITPELLITDGEQKENKTYKDMRGMEKERF